MALNLIVLSPQQKVLETTCRQVTLPTTDGEITILPRHIPLFTQLGQGEIQVKTDEGKMENIVVSGGFANINQNKVVVLAEFGVVADQISEAEVQKAKQRAEEILKTISDDKAQALAQADLARSILQLKVLKKRRR